MDLKLTITKPPIDMPNHFQTTVYIKVAENRPNSRFDVIYEIQQKVFEWIISKERKGYMVQQCGFLTA